MLNKYIEDKILNTLGQIKKANLPHKNKYPVFQGKNFLPASERYGNFRPPPDTGRGTALADPVNCGTLPPPSQSVWLNTPRNEVTMYGMCMAHPKTSQCNVMAAPSHRGVRPRALDVHTSPIIADSHQNLLSMLPRGLDYRTNRKKKVSIKAF